MSADLLSARDLEVTFVGRHGRPDAKGVDGVHLDIGSGEIVALVGESGCGKTTLARTLLGLERPSGGTVAYDGASLGYKPSAMRAYRRRVQLILQDPTGALNPRHNVYESVAEGIRIHKLVDRNRAEGKQRDRGRPGGRRLVARRFAATGAVLPELPARAVRWSASAGGHRGGAGPQPDVLIADEPVSSLDASIRGEILALLLRLREDLGLSVLVVTHDLGLAWNIADRIAVMYLGRIVEVGTTEEVLAAPKHPYTRALLSVVPEIEQLEPTVLEGETPDPTRIPRGCRFHPRCPALLLGEAAAAGVDGDCRSKPLPLLSAAGDHRAACWLPGRLVPD